MTQVQRISAGQSTGQQIFSAIYISIKLTAGTVPDGISPTTYGTEAAHSTDDVDIKFSCDRQGGDPQACPVQKVHVAYGWICRRTSSILGFLLCMFIVLSKDMSPAIHQTTKQGVSLVIRPCWHGKERFTPPLDGSFTFHLALWWYCDSG